ncbi:helix-turn-helix domain-containing protein [Breoghania sp. L-A4]|uniref:XRE family transcriptional regulator n=1 Tax=Breoghania sp. L-A4 TaxID=2304600 RepID=UPI000E35F8ED|nr:helix-turn-helix domain-containing protein [Breoghania sp. L-A4]AXS39803.1 helix-turn-helix domain-containing protein [Breoghania sp. L-A4]
MTELGDNPIVLRIDARLKELGLSREAAAVQAGLSRDAIRNLAQEPNRKPRGSMLERLADVLRVPPGWLLTGHDAEQDRFTQSADFSPSPATQPTRNDVPVMGTAAGSLIHGDFESFSTNGPIDHVRRPPVLVDAKDLCAIYITGDSISPEQKPCVLRFVHPHRPVQPGCTVIVQTRRWNDDPSQAYIKTFVRRTADRIVVQQINPAATIEIPIEHVHTMRRVLTINELFGV